MFRCAAFLLLHRLFSSRNEHKILLIALHRFLIAVASFVAKHRLKNTELQQLWHTGSIVAVPKSSRAQAQSVQFSSVQSLSHVQLCDSMNQGTFSSVRFSSVTQSCPTLLPHESQHARPPYPSSTPGVHTDSCP